MGRDNRARGEMGTRLGEGLVAQEKIGQLIGSMGLGWREACNHM